MRCLRSADAKLASPTICCIGSAQGGLSLLWSVRRWRAGLCCSHEAPVLAPRGLLSRGLLLLMRSAMVAEDIRASRSIISSSRLVEQWIQLPSVRGRWRSVRRCEAGGIECDLSPLSQRPCSPDRGSCHRAAMTEGAALVLEKFALSPPSRASRATPPPNGGKTRLRAYPPDWSVSVAAKKPSTGRSVALRRTGGSAICDAYFAWP
jgi:hypothetical protein